MDRDYKSNVPFLSLCCSLSEYRSQQQGQGCHLSPPAHWVKSFHDCLPKSMGTRTHRLLTPSCYSCSTLSLSLWFLVSAYNPYFFLWSRCLGSCYTLEQIITFLSGRESGRCLFAWFDWSEEAPWSNIDWVCSTVMEEVHQCRMAAATCWKLSVLKTDLTEISVRLWLLEPEADEVEWSHKETVCCPEGPHGCSSSQKSL